MLLSLALVVLFSAIIVFFADEFLALFKKFFSIPGFKLLIPLILASLLIEAYEEWGLWLLLSVQRSLHILIYKLATLLPFEKYAVLVVRILFLLLAAIFPMCISRLRAKQQGRRRPESFTFWLGLTLWIIAVILLAVAI